MKLSKNSWHYKYYNFWNLAPTDSLCVYFWNLTFALTIIPVAILISSLVVAVIFIFAAFLPALITGELLGFSNLLEANAAGWSVWHLLGIGWGFIAAVVALVTLGLKSFGYLAHNGYLSLACEAIKGKIKGICPTIIWIDK